MTIPAAVALIVIPIPLVAVLFERGAFNTADTQATALAVAVYGLGLPAFVMQKTLQPLFFAREDTKRPFQYAVVAMILNAVIAVGLAPVIGYIAAAIGTTATGWAMVALLWRGSRGMGPSAQFDDCFKRRIWLIVAASLGMGIVLLGLSAALGTPSVLGVAALVVAGIVSYFGIGHLIGAFQLGEFLRALRS